ncbi:MAG: SMP-30/gluconolactonase/LRE family protein [bacterium]|nr:SMP-30/gluconolactonase/LRE family protein [bacterium]
MGSGDTIFARDSKLEKVADGCAFTEGPAADERGNLFFSDCPNNRIMILPPNWELEEWRHPSGLANGMNFDASGRLVTCCGSGEGGARAVQRYEEDGSITILASSYNGHRLNSPNDLCFDRNGRIYFTDPRYGDREGMEQDVMGVYRIDSDGTVERVIEDVQTPNGILMSADNRTLYVVDNNPEEGGAPTLLEYGADKDGRWLRKSEIYDFSPGRGADGMVLDTEGNLYVTAGREDRAGVYVFTATGQEIGFLPTPEPPTNCTFGGEDLKTLYITAGTSVYRIRGTVEGFLAFPRIS